MLTANLHERDLHERACLQANSLVFDVDRFIHLCIFFFCGCVSCRACIYVCF